MTYPSWVVLHVPHDSTDVPHAVREQFLLNDEQLAIELNRMTDHRTRALFVDQSSDAATVRAPVSRLVVDVERFASDDDEPMAARGMGAVYTLTSGLAPLRRELSSDEREALMQAYYFPHHVRLEAAVAASVERHGRCLVLGAHSFPDRPLPYERAAADAERPDICIGTDSFHTSEALARAFVTAFRRAGWRVAVNEPFAGALVPSDRFGRDRRVAAVMVEINRRLYLKAGGAEVLPEFAAIARQVRQCCDLAIASYALLDARR
ncbi:N-formylglutamate amidohydrolase [Variovorax sp. J22R133]|uniref:N-formylglutamate amidohydrolase n=1 Tax=Variovorax brevis TaxID=3053503 RepID=UPI002575BA50|nr:N-formylglutamate amidohydrolase [Variovorax sp. J22R133]MDM0113941.1 N-formylglutamate amidohydrolase [Variovorax sp. J22R133]